MFLNQAIFERIIQVFPALGFDDPDFHLGALDDEIGNVVGDAAWGRISLAIMVRTEF
jgi:hypothetical protein